MCATSHPSLGSLKSKLSKEWDAIPQEHIRAACDAFVDRLKAVSRTLDFYNWFILEDKMCATPHPSLGSLKSKLSKEWDAIPQEHLRAAGDAFVERLMVIIRNKGYYIE